jgi:starch-binding outer membrane protein, SusD/RagB family
MSKPTTIHSIKNIVVLSAIVLITSCEGFLDKEPQTSISKEEALNSIFDIHLALNGAYNTMTNTACYGQFMMVYGDLTGGTVKPTSRILGNDTESYRPIYNFTMFPEMDTYTSGNYAGMYRVLNAVNNIITAIPALPDGTVEERNQALGEALAIRGLVHFDLLRLYAQPYNFTSDASHIGIVLALRTIKPDERLARGTVQEGYDAVVNDLEEAIDLLQVNTNRIKFNQVSAKAILARVMLYSENWSRAAALATEVIQSNVTLVPHSDLATIWTNDYTSNEYVLRLSTAHYVQNTLAPEWSPSNSTPSLSLSTDILNLYQQGDIRSTLLVEDESGDHLTVKYPFANNEANDIPVFRLSEAYLIRAEAYASLDRPELGRADVNVARKRANPNAADVLSTGEMLINDIMDERRREFAFEGHHLFDLTRRKKGVNRTDCDPGTTVCTLSYPSDKFVIPIPQLAIEANNRLKQNKGY